MANKKGRHKLVSAFLQDGNHNKQKSYYKFSTQSFNEKEVERLSIMLNQLLGITSDVQIWEDKPVIIVTKTNGESILSDCLRQNAPFACFKYKL